MNLNLVKHRPSNSWLLLVVLVPAFLQQASAEENISIQDHDTCLQEPDAQVWIEGGEFTMGAQGIYPEEGPAHPVTLDGFWIDSHEVTNQQFSQFVQDTGYVTVAERVPNSEDWPGVPPEQLQPGSVTFTPPTLSSPTGSWWSFTPGANWRNPLGPGSSIDSKSAYPVVHIAFEDAQAYAEWAGRELPSEAQFEYAARSGLNGEKYGWEGDELAPGGKHQANTWQGIFPVNNNKADGFAGLAPVGCFGPNNYGVYDLIGNVWEWAADWYAPGHNPTAKPNPIGPAKEDSYDRNNPGFPVKVIKGGSFLCAPNYCKRYRPAARHAQDVGLGTSHIGFRTVLNRAPAGNPATSNTVQ
jgi:sulfatase modifying factor 1